MRYLAIVLAGLFFAGPVAAEPVENTGIICEDPKDAKNRVYYFYEGKVHEVYLGQYKIVRVISLTSYDISDSEIIWSLPIRGTTWEYRREFDRTTLVLLKEYINHALDESGKAATSHKVSYQCQTTDKAGIEDLYGPGALDLIVRDRDT